MTDYVRGGAAFQGDIGLHFSPSWTFYGFWEYARFSKGNANSLGRDIGASNAIGIGINANTNPRGVGFYFDIGAAYRWVTFDMAQPTTGGSGTATFAGIEPIRLGLGIAINVSRRFRLDVLANFSAGAFSTASLPAGACPTSANCSNLGDVSGSDRRGVHVFSGLVVAGHWDL